MNSLWKLPPASAISRWVRNKNNLMWLAGGGASVAFVLISCGTTGRTMMAPPSIPGAEFIGTEACAECHDKLVRDFRTADHAKLQAKGPNSIDMGCESCHGPGSKHKEAGGGPGTIINPDKSPETCFQCHIDKKGEFMLPYSHPVLSGKMTCTECHDPHKGDALMGGGTNLARANELCLECHTAQRGPFVFPHDAVREGCGACHNPHGSVNQKMLTERSGNLCQKCHYQDQHSGIASTSSNILIGGGGHGTLNNRLGQGTCWSNGCHEAVHGSNVNSHFRN